ncbi:hypothetical protein [Fluviispira sanaruensis]|uniref:Uncharacterized protein n=1 Tax=Fluviispira sanaruensis TaxID=2493639 RepID=A0A4P2VJL3_FLUSA|nr:hypothetical protein [Fluviispira sanaruensis]BBH52901.1 hypothetical protein JCM31447_13440 [Fluviispira sanaruensis]
MAKITKILLIVGLLVGAFAVVLLNRKKDTEVKSEKSNELSMTTKIYDKATGKVDEAPSHSPESYFGSLSFIGSEPNSKDMAQAILCVDQVADIEKIDLYMPDMGHGTQPPVVNKHEDISVAFKDKISAALKEKAAANPYFGCIHISAMQLYMPGLWQVRVFYKNDTVGLFDFNIKD